MMTKAFLVGQAVVASTPATRGSRPQSVNVVAVSSTRRSQLAKRHKRVRNSVEGSTERPATSTLSASVKEKLGGKGTNNAEAAAAVGSVIAELCKEKKIEKVCFDRGGFQYHGRVQALADAAREGGLSFRLPIDIHFLESIPDRYNVMLQ
eukprot:jgi/Picre1/28351/NNA_003757.t1